MTDERTKSICSKKVAYPNAPTFKEHKEFMFECSRSLWKQHMEEIKNKTKRPPSQIKQPNHTGQVDWVIV